MIADCTIADCTYQAHLVCSRARRRRWRVSNQHGPWQARRPSWSMLGLAGPGIWRRSLDTSLLIRITSREYIYIYIFLVKERGGTNSLLVNPLVLPISALHKPMMKDLEMHWRTPKRSCAKNQSTKSFNAARNGSGCRDVLNPRSHVRTKTSPSRHTRFLSFALSE